MANEPEMEINRYYFIGPFVEGIEEQARIRVRANNREVCKFYLSIYNINMSNYLFRSIVSY